MERRAPSQSRGLTAYRAYELLNGKIDYPVMSYYSGYGDGQSTDLSLFISEQMRADWLGNRKLLLRVWQSGELFPHDVLDWRPHLSIDHDGHPLP